MQQFIYNEGMTITWDLFILLFFGVATIYGALLGRNRILGILVNSYIGLAVAEVLGEWVYNLISGVNFISANLITGVFGAKILVMVIIVAALTLKSELSGVEGYGFSKVQGGIYGFLTAGLLLSTASFFMTESERISFFAESNFANLVFAYHGLWILAPVAVMIGSTFIKGKK